MSGRDLKKMKAGLMDPSGEGPVVGAWGWAFIGMWITVGGLVLLILLLHTGGFGID
jgi:hypothetical protein